MVTDPFDPKSVVIIDFGSTIMRDSKRNHKREYLNDQHIIAIHVANILCHVILQCCQDIITKSVSSVMYVNYILVGFVLLNL